MAVPFDVDSLARDIGQRISSQLPHILRRLLAEHNDFGSGQLNLEFLDGQSGPDVRPRALKLASIDIADVVSCATPSANEDHPGTPTDDLFATPNEGSGTSSPVRTFRPRSSTAPYADDDSRPAKRRATGGLRIGSGAEQSSERQIAVTRRLESDGRVFPQRKKRLPDNPQLQPSTVSK
jgi:hypothetical protein